MPAGLVTVAVLVKAARTFGATVAVIVNVALPVFGSVSSALTLPEPLATPLAPLAYDTVHCALESFAGSTSATVAPMAVLGPLFLTTSV